MSTADDNPAVILEEREAAGGRRVAFAQLNAERSLNALSQPMIDVLLPQLRRWATRDDIACVVLSGSGEKAFCAGGDIVSLYKAVQAGKSREAEGYFADEYRLDHLIHRYPKPVLCWGHGTVMGGGLGLMAGASHRVATESSRIAMPEVTIGFFPDIGASWFLGRMPARIGLFMGLTTTPLAAGDALWLGLADYYLDSAQRGSLFDTLCALDWRGDRAADDALLAGVLRDFENTETADTARRDSAFFARQGAIAAIGEAEDAADYLQRLQHAAERDDWFAHGARAMKGGSPTSLTLVHRQFYRDARLSIEEAFRQELTMAIQGVRDSDFIEGVRALLIDKDKNPQWRPARLADVDAARIDAFFQLPDDYSSHPLQNL